MSAARYKAFALTTLTTALGLAACSITVPVAVTGKNLPGGVLHGTATGSFLTSGSISVANSAISCTGSYDAFDQSPEIAIPLQCSDGRAGTAVATRYGRNHRNGRGTFTMNDGSTGYFAFGAEAPLIRPMTANLAPATPAAVSRPTESTGETAPPSRHEASEVRLEKRGGAYYVPVRINDTVTIPFVLDTGASDLLG
jgi:hypothetical protein